MHRFASGRSVGDGTEDHSSLKMYMHYVPFPVSEVYTGLMCAHCASQPEESRKVTVSSINQTAPVSTPNAISKLHPYVPNELNQDIP